MNFEESLAALRNISWERELSELARKEIAPYRGMDIPIPENAKSAAVLLHCFPWEGIAHFVLIERPSYDGVHSGQIALPGGKQEKDDLDLFHTAKREAFEEVNIEPHRIEVVSSMNHVYIPPSNFHVLPVLSYSEQTPNFLAEEREVAEIIKVPLQELLSCQVKQKNITLPNQLKFKTPYLPLQNKVVWGATAVILNEFRVHLNQQIKGL